MIDKETAEKLATEFINSSSIDEEINNDLIIVDKATIEKPYGWIFSYDSRKFLETGDFTYSILGNGPIVVDKETMEVRELGGGPYVERFIAEYEENREINIH
jgi:Immunity protein 35